MLLRPMLQNLTIKQQGELYRNDSEREKTHCAGCNRNPTGSCQWRVWYQFQIPDISMTRMKHTSCRGIWLASGVSVRYWKRYLRIGRAGERAMALGVNNPIWQLLPLNSQLTWIESWMVSTLTWHAIGTSTPLISVRWHSDAHTSSEFPFWQTWKMR
jgi:hypothetical protein